uniref:P-type atpase n=1 Tax=Tetraselmis sp. GSL018 TaxID=582737 RepID=A0A061QI03_9CHLO
MADVGDGLVHRLWDCQGRPHPEHRLPAAARNGARLENILLKLLDMVTIAVPPALPACLSVAASFSVWRLQKRGIFCTDTSAIAKAGAVDTVVFDKTGTLTRTTVHLDSLWVVGWLPEDTQAALTCWDLELTEGTSRTESFE